MPGKATFSLLAMTAAAILTGTAGASAKELVYGSGIPAKSDQMGVGMKTYTEDLAKASNGTLTMKVLAGGQVVSLYNTLAALRDGTIDAGFIVPTFTRKELKHVNVIYDTEIFGADPAAITGAANETLLLNCPTCMKDFRDNRSVYLASFGNNQKGLVCRKEVKTLAEAELVLVADLVGETEVERLPDADSTVRLLGLDIAAVRLVASQASAPIKLALALAKASRS